MSERRKVLELFEKQKEYMDKRVAEGIEKYRKGDAKITLTDKKGNPIKGAKVKAIQKTHEFRFGANLFLLDELETEEKNQKYRELFADVFNIATLPFYWNTLEPERGETRYEKNSPPIYRRPPIELCMEYCEEKGIEPREHALAFDAYFPDWLSKLNLEETKAALEQRFKEISERYADKINNIEVTNEMERDHWVSCFYNEPDYVEWCFKMAEKYFPNNHLTINDHTPVSWLDCCRASDKYYAYIEANMLKGARIDGIGMQYHLFYTREQEYEKTRRLLNPESLYKHMDLYANFGKPLQVTEITVPSYSWEAEDEEIQAEILENLYSIWFSHPNMEQIIYWNLVDGYTHVWNPDPRKIKESQGNMSLGQNYYHGGLLRFDLSPKPAFNRIKKLIKETWHTEESLVTNGIGLLTFKGFYGEYDLLIELDGKTVKKEIKTSSKGDNVFIFAI